MYLRNRKYFLSFYRVIETQGEVYEKREIVSIEQFRGDTRKPLQTREFSRVSRGFYENFEKNQNSSK